METLTLSDEQSTAAEKIFAWIRSPQKQEFRLGGYAGVGKSFLISYILRRFDENRLRYGVGAFTGKAASVLRRKGVLRAKTIHSMIYDPSSDVRGKTVFVKKPRLNLDVIVIDEASMIAKEIYNDLISFRVPVLFVGDMGQLEPIGEDPRLMEEAKLDAKLLTIHRQAAQSPIIRFCHELRRGKVVTGEKACPELSFGDYDRFVECAGDVEQLICGYNKTRCEINAAFRKASGYTGILQAGERVICLRNNSDLGIFNGMIASVLEVDSDDSCYPALHVTLRDEMDRVVSVVMDRRQFGLEKTMLLAEQSPDLTYWDWAYCISCHKSQGSEFESVAVYEQVASSWDRRRWSYTAASRAAKRLVYCR